ncbi:hypothetical protein C0J52_24953 [Blattella germanica]|nr:hypothetical protein C0J52_24953 [Blattella germanica]
MPSCFVPGCRSGYGSYSANEVKHFFMPPKNKEMFEKWARAINRKDRQLTIRSPICYLHFSDELINKTDKFVINNRKVELPRLRWGLKPDAVPDIFPELPPSKKKNKKKSQAKKPHYTYYLHNSPDCTINNQDSISSGSDVEDSTHPKDSHFSQSDDQEKKKDLEIESSVSKDDIKTEDICWVSETVSSEDSSHSANPLALEDESNPIPEAPSCSTTLLEPSLIISDVLPSSSKEAEITPVPTVTLATNILPPPNQQLVPSQTALSSSNELVASPTHILGTDMMLPPKQLVLSKSVLSTEQGSCVNQSLSITNNKSGVENIPLEVCEVSFEPANKQLELDETLPNTDRIDTALRRLEDISDKVNQLNETNDNFDSFGRYVASLLRSLPIQNVVTVQQDVLSLIFRSCAQPPADQDEPTKGTSTLDKVPGTSSVTQNSSGAPPNSTETQQIPQNSSVASPKLAETQQPPPSTSPTPQNTSVHQCISVAQQNVKRNKRSHVECEILPEIRTKQSKIDESLIHTNQIDASLKRLKDISKRVKESSLWDDAFDKFGRYIASLLRCTDPQSTIGLQNEIVDLIMKSRALHLDHV